MVVSKKDDTMESMSNTRQEIANRLGSLAHPGVSEKFALPTGVVEGIEKGIAKNLKMSEQAKRKGQADRVQWYLDDAKDLTKIKQAILRGDGGEKHAKKIADMIWNLDTAVRGDCGRACINWASKAADEPINYSRSGAKTTMGMKLVKNFPAGSNGLSAKVYRDSDYNGYLVRFFESGKHNENADYDTEDLQDAIGTAQYSISHYKLARPGSKANMAAASGAPDTSMFADRIRKYEARESKDELMDPKVIKQDVRALNAVLMYVKAGDRNRAVKWVDSMDTLVSDVIPRSIYNWIYKGYSARPGAKEKMAMGEPDLRSFRLPGEMAAVRKKIEEYTRALNNDDRSGKYTNAAARCKAIGAMYGSGGGSLSSLYEEYADALKNRGYARSGAKAKFEATGSKKYFLGELDTIIAGISNMNRLLEKQAKGNPKIKEVLTALNKAESVMVAAESKLMQIDFSRSGAKVKFNWKESTTKINDDLNVALQAINANDLDKAIRYIKQAQTRAFYIFSRPGVKTKMAADWKIGDAVHLGMGTVGGVGYNGIITKLDGDTVYIESTETDNKYGPRTFKGLVRYLSRNSRSGAKL